MAESSPQIHGLLIGINHYQPNRLYKNLRGCVRDINLVDAYLQQSLRVSSKHIRRLTASAPEEIDLSRVRGGQLDAEPTYENITRAFADITQTAREGDRIYIHYSGHGGRVVTLYPELKGEGQNDEGLVPSDYATSKRYVRDIEIATLLKRMTDKGLMVTLILDSCHSGGATRGDCAIRGASEVDTQMSEMEMSEMESLVGSREELVANWRSLTEGSRKQSWLPGSQDYVLLAACRPTEFAFEYAVTGKERHGALTYWMIDTLNILGNQISYKTLHNRVSAKIQSKFPAQLPMLIGDAERTLFRGDRQSTKYTAAVLGISDNLITISAAMPQGISKGVRFAIYPLGCEDFSDRSKQQAIIEIIEVDTARSTGAILSVEEGGLPLPDKTIEQGAPAIMLSTPTDLKRQVRLYDQKQAGTQEHELPAAMVARQTPALEAVRKALSDNGWIIEVEGREESHYQVSISAEGAYEICIGMPLQNLTPALSIDDPNAPEKVVARLVHLAKYQAIQELDNPASELTEHIHCQLLDRAKQPITEAAPLTVKPGERLYLRIENTSSEALNVAVLDIEPTWAISQIPLKGLTAPFYQLDKGEVLDTPLGFVLPDTENYRQSNEILKIFATRGPADFRWLHLPTLDEEINAKSAEKMRSNNPFAKLLEAVGGDPAAAPSITRAVVYDSDPGAAWVTKQIPLVIEQREE